MEERGEVCLAEEAERLRRSGLSVEDVSRRMGVDAAWVESVVSPCQQDDEHRSDQEARGVPANPCRATNPTLRT